MKVDVLSNEVFFLKLAECLHLVFYEAVLLRVHGSTSIEEKESNLLSGRGVSTPRAPSREVCGVHPC